MAVYAVVFTYAVRNMIVDITGMGKNPLRSKYINSNHYSNYHATQKQPYASVT